MSDQMKKLTKWEAVDGVVRHALAVMAQEKLEGTEPSHRVLFTMCAMALTLIVNAKSDGIIPEEDDEDAKMMAITCRLGLDAFMSDEAKTKVRVMDDFDAMEEGTLQ